MKMKTIIGKIKKPALIILGLCLGWPILLYLLWQFEMCILFIIKKGNRDEVYIR